MQQPASRTQPLSCTSKNSQIERLSDTLLLGVASKNLTKQGAAAHVSTLLDVVTTLTNRKAAEALLLGGVEAHEGPRDMWACDSKNSHGTRGCRAHVEALAGLPDALRPVSRLVEEYPEMCQQKLSAKTLTEQGAAAHMSKLLDVVTTVTDRRMADALVSRLLKAEGICGDVTAKTLTEQAWRAHVEASACALRPLRMAELRASEMVWELQGLGRPGEAWEA